MPCRQPHPQTIFHLVPISDKAKSVLLHPDNESFVSESSATSDFKSGLEIGYHVSVRPRPQVIVEVGRNADLILPGSSISAIHFSFEVHPESGEIMFHDRSRYHSTNIRPFEFRQDGLFRQVVLQPGQVYRIGAGGEHKDLYQFELHWVAEEQQALQQVEQGYRHAAENAKNPRWARTIDDGPTELPSWYNTRLHTPRGGAVQRAVIRNKLGKGNFGVVLKGVDLDSGGLIAVKKMDLPHGWTVEDESRLRREVKILSGISHKNIVEYLGSDGWGSQTIHLYTGLKTGNVNELFTNKPTLRTDASALNGLMRQMLEALDYLDYWKLVHRDVKPDNILYTLIKTDNYHFQLADFGFANAQNLARTHCGSPVYMAPEMYYGNGVQTSKMDVWSLFATLMFVMGVEGLHERKTNHYEQGLNLLRMAAKRHTSVRPMAHEDPTKRASAAQMLKTLYNGEGLTTPSRHIAPIID